MSARTTSVVYRWTVQHRPLADDLVLLVQACHAGFSQRVLDEVRRRAGGAVRFGDGYVFQHLIAGGRRVTELAELLGVSQQAASKQVADMEARGLVRRMPDPTDRRAKLVMLADVGQGAVEAARAVRSELGDDVEELIGPDALADLKARLATIAAALGADRELLGRRLRPEGAR